MIAILNLSANGNIMKGIDNMKFFDSLQDIIETENKPLENRAIGLMAISNIYTLCPNKVKIREETKNFAKWILKSWKEKQAEKETPDEVVKNLVYASLILFYNILLKESN